MREMLAHFKITGLRARLLGVVLLAVVPLTFLLVAYAGIVNREALDNARSDVKDGLAHDVLSLQDLIVSGHTTLETFGITYAVQAHDWALAQGNSDRLRAVHPSYVVIAIADPQGHVRAASPRPRGTLDVSNDPLFKRAVASKGLVVGGYEPDPISGQRTMRICLPVYGPESQLVAVEWIAFSAAEFERRMTAPEAASTETMLDSSATVVAAQPPNPSVQGKPLADHDLARLVLAKRRGETTAKAPGGSEYTYFAPVLSPEQGSLYLMVSLSTDQLFASQRRTFAMTLLGFGAFALLALVGAWLVGTYSIYRPALYLRRAAERLSQGDLTARALFADRKDEFGELKLEFNDMAEALQSQVEELRRTRQLLADLNADLEERVSRRTAELEASNKELEAFSYSVSHDLRSPLRAIDGFSLALLEDYWDQLDDEARDDLRRVRENASRMGELIDSLLMLSRLSRQEMRVQDVDLSALASEVAAELRQLEPDRSVSISVQPGVHGKGDPTLLRNALGNLLGNAWKFTSEHDSATIAFGAEEVDGKQAYFVRDDGAGFDMAYANKLFGAFQRLHGQSEFPGIGIGLATTARIVHRHGGRIWAEGEPEKGATFWFTLG
jgi:signal transduction histidine kinase